MPARVTYADLTTPDQIVAQRLTVTAGSSDIDVDDATRRDLTATIADPTGILTPKTADDLLEPFVTEVTIRSGWRYSDGTEDLNACGVFRVTQLVVNDLGNGTKIDLTGQDRSVIVRGNSPQAVAVPPNTNIIDAIRLLVKARYPAATFTATTSAYICPPLFFPANTDLWDAARKLANSAGLDVAFGPTGDCVIRPIPSIGADTPVTLTYGAADGQYPLWDLKRTQAAQDTPNGVIMTGNHSSLPAPVRGEAWITDPLSPLRKDGPYGEQPVYESSSSISTAAQATLAAQARLEGLLGSADTLTFATVPNARVDAGDVIGVDRPILAASGLRWLVTHATLPWVATDAMQLTAKRRLKDTETS